MSGWRSAIFERPQGGERAVLVGVGIGHPIDPNDIAEFAALAASAGTVSVGYRAGARARAPTPSILSVPAKPRRFTLLPRPSAPTWCSWIKRSRPAKSAISRN